LKYSRSAPAPRRDALPTDASVIKQDSTVVTCAPVLMKRLVTMFVLTMFVLNDDEDDDDDDCDLP